MVTKTSNKSISLEFFANAYVELKKNYCAIVRGKEVSYASREINRLLGLPVPEVCDVERGRNPMDYPNSHDEWDEMMVGLMKEGKGWRRKSPTSNPQRINTSHLLPVYRAWASFINATIEGTSSAAEMIVSRVFILLVLLSEHEQMNVGRLITASIKEMVTTSNTTLGHSCLINFFCEKAGVPTEPLDVYVKSKLPITDTSLEGYEKKLREEGSVQNEPEEQPEVHEEPEAEYPPMHPALAEYINASANWMEEASSQMYIEPPRFSDQFAAMALKHKRKPGGSFERFSSREQMRSYFQVTRDRAVQREQDIEEEYTYGKSVELAGILYDPPPQQEGVEQQDPHDQ